MAGEESEETKAQKLREMKELEVFYPRSTSIPRKYDICSSKFILILFVLLSLNLIHYFLLRGPHISLDTKNEHYDDRQTDPIVPSDAVRDEDDADLEKPVSTSIPAGADHVVTA